jgi:hypothetical protein
MRAAAMLDELLRAFAGAVPGVQAEGCPANAANPAIRKRWRGFPAGGEACEGLRIAANPAPGEGEASPDSQAFAGVRSAPNCPESEERRGLSQDSQVSQVWTGTIPTGAELGAVAWTDADLARFVDRRARLLRWGWAEPEAEALAERLVIRDRGADARVTCAECQHYRPGKCANHQRAGLQTADVGRELAGLLQRCGGFNERG